MHTKHAALLVAGILIAILVAVAAERDEEGPKASEAASITPRSIEDQDEAPTERLMPQRARPTGSSFSRKSYSFVSATRAQSYSHREGGREFTIQNTDLTKTPYDIRSYEYSASFDIVSVSSQEEDKFFVLGEAADGDQVLQAWTHKKRKAQMIGGPVSYRLVRTEIFRGTSLGLIKHMTADPFGRFLMLVHTDANGTHVSQMSLSTGNPVTELIDPTQNNWLSGSTNGAYARQHVSEGLVWRMDLYDVPYGGMSIIFRDIDGDGLFTDIILLDELSTTTLYPYEYPSPGIWVEDFIHY